MTDSNTPQPTGEVSEADREAAAKIIGRPDEPNHPVNETAAKIRAGRFDIHPWVRAFRDHRLASTAQAQAEIARLQETVDALALQLDESEAKCLIVYEKNLNLKVRVEELEGLLAPFAAVGGIPQASSGIVIGDDRFVDVEIKFNKDEAPVDRFGGRVVALMVSLDGLSAGDFRRARAALKGTGQ